jgi:predicted ATPase/class 3 adenylate cyclase
MTEQPTGTVTMLFTDIEGSTRLLERLGPEQYGEALELHRRLLREAFERQGGYEVDYEGDAFFVAFAGAARAVAAASEGQTALAQAEWPAAQEIRVRMGIHTGDPLAVPPKYVGLDVHKAARIMAAGHGGQVLVSEATQRLLREIEVVGLGEHRLKDLLQPEPLYQLVVAGLPAEFPALKTLGNRPTNLPVQPNALIGRTTEVAEVVGLLRAEAVRLLSLTGAGGTGKTRLALQAAVELLDDLVSGVFFVSLAPVQDAALVVPTIAQTFAVREVPGEALSDTLALYLEHKQLLIVLDNFEQVMEAAGDVAVLLRRCPKLKLLITSRERLRLAGERVYAVPPLVLADERLPLEVLLQNEAVALFAERAQAATGTFVLTRENAPLVAAICRRLDGLPLAIELAAARTNVLSPQALLPRLDRRLTLLTTGDRDADDRQRTLRAAIEWSYELLSVTEQKLFARLALFDDGCRLEAAQKIYDPDGDHSVDILDGIGLLVEKNLVRVRSDPDGEFRYWMLETIAEYAFERLQESGEFGQLARQRARYFLGLAEAAEPEFHGDRQAHWLRLLEADLANLRGVVAWAEREHDGELLLRLVSALSGFLDVRGHGVEARSWLQKALELGGGRVDVAVQARALAWASDLARIQGDLEEARRFCERAVSLAEQSGKERLLWQALHDLGEVAAYEGDYPAARRLYERVVALATEAGETPAGTITNLGQLAILERDFDRAREFTMQALASFRESGRREGEAVCLGNLATIAISERDFQRSVELFEQTLDVALDLGFRECIAGCLLNLGGLIAREGSAEDGARVLSTAEAIRRAAAVEIDPSDREWHEGSITALESRLDPAALATHWAEGAALDVQEASTLAREAAREAVVRAARRVR